VANCQVLIAPQVFVYCMLSRALVDVFILVLFLDHVILITPRTE